MKQRQCKCLNSDVELDLGPVTGRNYKQYFCGTVSGQRGPKLISYDPSTFLAHNHYREIITTLQKSFLKSRNELVLLNSGLVMSLAVLFCFFVFLIGFFVKCLCG